MVDIRVVVIDDHPTTAQGTAEILGRMDGIESVGYALELESEISLIRDTRPAVVLCDIMIGDKPLGFDLPGRLGRAGLSDTRVILFSYFANSVTSDEGRAAGAAAVVDKAAKVEGIRDIIVAVACGGELPTRIPILDLPRDLTGPRVPSPREVEILQLLADGKSTIQVGYELGIADRTVETHLERMSAPYKVNNRTQLVALAGRRGWLIRSPH